MFFFFLSFWLSCLRLAGVLAPGLTGKGAGEDKPVSPVRGLALEGLGGLAIGLSSLDMVGLRSPPRLALKVSLHFFVHSLRRTMSTDVHFVLSRRLF